MSFTIVYAFEVHTKFTDGLPRIKLGEHFANVDDWQEAEESCRAYLKKWQKICKDDFNQYRMQFWDFSTLSVNEHKLGLHRHGQRIDDKIRHFSDKLRLSIVQDKTKRSSSKSKVDSSEFHNIPFETVVEEIDKIHYRLLQPKNYITCQLSKNQHDLMVDVKDAIAQNKRTILADLAPRFGKTIWSLALAKELDVDVMVVASYVKTVFTSFKTDIKQFEQFKDYAVVDLSTERHYKKIIDHNLKQYKKIIFCISLCQSEYRNTRIDYLFSKDKTKLLIIDEADYGGHCENQSSVLIKNFNRKTDVAVLMTGTNSKRAQRNWSIDHTVTCTYLELLLEKETIVDEDLTSQLTHFDININLNKNVCGLELYQMDVKHVYDLYSGEIDLKEFPSWSKLAQNPYKAKSFYTSLIEGLFKGMDDSLVTNIDYQLNPVDTDIKVYMMFFSANNVELKQIADMTRQALSNNHNVFLISGIDNITNENAEQEVKTAILKSQKENKNLILISSNMAQRSFSIPEIETVLLCYDRGEVGTTIQKLSRCLTPYKHIKQKTGKVISLSFDPNRDDKFDWMITETARNYSKHHNVDIDIANRKVLKTINIFKCTEDGRLKIDIDEYAKNLYLNKPSQFYEFSGFDIHNLEEDIKNLFLGSGVAVKKTYLPVFSGEVFQETPKANLSIHEPNNTVKKTTKKDYLKIKACIDYLIEHLDILKYVSADNSHIIKCLDFIEHHNMTKEIEEYLGFDFNILNDFFRRYSFFWQSHHELIV